MDRAARILRKAGLKATGVRIAILEILLEAPEPLAHRDVLKRAGRQGLDRVSAYRSLQAFVEKGIAHRLVTEDRVGRFALSGGNRSHPLHPHFLCRSCGKVECLTRIRMPAVTRGKLGHRIEEQFWYLRGVCSQCLAGC